MMNAVKFFLLLTVFFIAASISGTKAEMDSGDKPSTYSAGSTELDSPAYPVHQMVIGFLEDIIQTNYVTEMERFLATPDAFLNSWQDGWDEWLLYLIGFIVCVSIGIFLFFAMFVVCCCHCCNSKKKKKKKNKKQTHPDKSDFSKCCCVSFSVIMLVVVAGMIISVVPMFTMNNRINTEISEGVWTKMSQSIDKAYSFLTTAVEDINDALYNEYVKTEATVFEVLYAVPANSIQVLENATGLGAAARGIVVFTQQLPDLESNLTAADNLTKKLQSQQQELENEIAVLISNITDSSSCSSVNASKVCQDVKSIKVMVDFSQVNLTNALTMVNYTVSSGFAEIVNNITRQVLTIADQVNATIIPAIDTAANQSQVVKDQITEVIMNLNNSVKSLQVDQAKEKISTIQNDDIYVMAVTITYWVTFGLVVVLAVITFLFVMGLLFGVLLPYNKGRGSCCSKSSGASLLQGGSGVNFAFYWLYMLLLVLLFAVGGMLHTEVCRHVTKVENAESFAVLQIFDNWINQSLYGKTGYNISVLPFDTYRLCSNNTAIYTALHLEEQWNMTQIAFDAEQEIDKAFDEIKNTEISLSPIDLTNPTVDQVLQGLDVVFGPNGLNFTAMITYLDRSIVEPNLTKIIEDLYEVNMTSYAEHVQYIQNNFVIVMESDKEALIKHLKIVDSIVSVVSFLGTAQTFNFSEAVINENGTTMVSEFVNKTADDTEAMLVEFTRDTTYSFENDVARCLPLYAAVEQTTDSACVYFLYSLNGLWFCLGSCTFFLLIGVLITPALVKVYRSAGPNKKEVVAHADKTPTNSDTISTPAPSSKAQAAVACATVSELGPPLKTQSYGSNAMVPPVQVHAVASAPQQEPSALTDHAPTGFAIAGTTVAVVEMVNHDTKTEQVSQSRPGMIKVPVPPAGSISSYPMVNQNIPQPFNKAVAEPTPQRNVAPSTNNFNQPFVNDAQTNMPPFSAAWHDQQVSFAPPPYSSVFQTTNTTTEPFIIPRPTAVASQLQPNQQTATSPLYSVINRTPSVYRNQTYEPQPDY